MSKVYLLLSSHYNESEALYASHDPALLQAKMEELIARDEAMQAAVQERNQRIQSEEVANPYQGPDIPKLASPTPKPKTQEEREANQALKAQSDLEWGAYVEARQAWMKPIHERANREVAAKYGVSYEDLVYANTEHELVYSIQEVELL